MNRTISKIWRTALLVAAMPFMATTAQATILTSSVTTIEVGNITDQVNNFWGHGDTHIFEENNVTYVLDSGFGLLHLNIIDLATGETVAVGNIVDKVNGFWGDKFEVFKHNNQWYVLDIGHGLAQLNKLNPETGETTAVGNLVDQVNNIWGTTFDVYKYNNEWYILDTGAGLAHLNKFVPETGATTAVGVMEDQVNHFWGDWDIKVVHDGDTWCIIDMAAGLLHANIFEPDTGKTIKGYDIADKVNYVWGAQFDTYVKDGKRYVFDVGAGLGHLNMLNCDRCSAHVPQKNAVISGLVYCDANKDKVYTEGEHGTANIVVSVTTVDLREYILITDATGHYTLPNVPLGVAMVRLNRFTLPVNPDNLFSNILQTLVVSSNNASNIVRHGFSANNCDDY